MQHWAGTASNSFAPSGHRTNQTTTGVFCQTVILKSSLIWRNWCSQKIQRRVNVLSLQDKRAVVAKLRTPAQVLRQQNNGRLRLLADLRHCMFFLVAEGRFFEWRVGELSDFAENLPSFDDLCEIQQNGFNWNRKCGGEETDSRDHWHSDFANNSFRMGAESFGC
jgi:hypothetical protein